ncbi:ybl17 [Escherichia coli]|nr:ybl17 [Escherichia coli]
MTPQQENALRSIARQANSEIKKARQQFPDKNVDDICRSVLKKHRETVTLMGFTPTHLSLAILRSTHNKVHYIRKGRTCIASMFRFNHDFEPVNKADADRIAEEIETAEHIKKLRDMRSKSRGNHGIIQPHTR